MTFRPLLLANKWTPRVDPTGWLMSYKLDGIRAYWDGEGTLWSRLGNPFKKAPGWFIDSLPPGTPLDGELYLGPGRFSDTVRAIKGGAGWGAVQYHVFDAPGLAASEGFRRRLERARRAQYLHARAWHGPGRVIVLEQETCMGLPHMLQTLADAEAQGIEGLMLRLPGSMYEGKRSRTLLKVKRFHDLEVEIEGHVAGRGKHAGRLGALHCRLPGTRGVTVDVGTGLSDAEREAPPPIGATITIKYQELTPAGVPRFPVYVGVRDYE